MKSKTFLDSLRSVSWCSDIVVFDSYSTDNTAAIATSAGARLIQRPSQDQSLPFGGDEGCHRTWGIRQISFKYDWLFVIDADERLSPDAVDELHAISIAKDLDCVAYRIRRRDFFQSRHLRYVQTSPWYIRFFRPEFVHFERLVNCVTVVDGPVGNLQHPLDHYPFSKGLKHWFTRHNSTAPSKRTDCSEPNQSRVLQPAGCLRLSVISTVVVSTRKSFFIAFPRPLIKFLLLYVLKRGFLDGRPGFTYALLQSIYEAMIVLKVQELERLESSN